MIRNISAPININLSLTEKCNLRCRHCLNFWRHDNSRMNTLSQEQLSRLFDMFEELGIFYVILNGGEPLLDPKLLEFAVRDLTRRNIAYSANSNLTLGDEETLKRLADAGIDHFLTSFVCSEEKITDEIMNVPGTFKKTIKAIETAVKLGIRVDANMVVGEHNRDYVYETGKLVAEIGCDKFFGTRLVPSPGETIPPKPELVTTKDEARFVMDELLRVKKDQGIMVGSLVSYPLCLLGDLEKYSDFVTRGCPSQSGRRMSIFANGDYSVCPHEPKFYGNVFETGLKKAWEHVSSWRLGEYHYEGCTGCRYLDVCNTGCRTTALAHTGKINSPDPLMEHKDNFKKHYRIIYDPSFMGKMEKGVRFSVPKRLKFRKEEDFYLVNIRWGNTISVDTRTGQFLEDKQSKNTLFTLDDFGKEKKEVLAQLFFKDAVESKEIEVTDNRKRIGNSVDPLSLK